VIGPILSLLIVAALGLRWMFVLTLIPGILAALLIAFFVREKKHQPHTHPFWHGIRKLPTNFRQYLVGVGLAGLGDYSNALLILWATQIWTARYGLMHAAHLAMAFYVGYNVIYTISCYLSGLFADRFPKNYVLAIGYSIAIIPALALLSPGDSLWKFAIVFGFAGLYMGVWETLESSTSALMLPSEVRGIGFGVLATVNGAGDLISSILIGALWAVWPAVAMLFVIATSLSGAVIIAVTRPVAADSI